MAKAAAHAGVQTMRPPVYIFFSAAGLHPKVYLLKENR